jgi:hypothetical protein
MATVRTSALFGLALAASACSNPKTTADATTPPPTGGCAAGQLVDGHGNCLTTCDDANDCATGEICHLSTGLCLPGTPPGECDPNSCAQGFVCPADGGLTCVPEDDACATDFDCAFGERCDAGRCVTRENEIVANCDADGDCPPLMSCQVGVCVGCIDDLQCQLSIPGSSCVLGTCVTADLPPAANCLTLQCADGERCDPVTGTCQPTCAANEDCEAGEICAPVLNQCVVDPGCADDTDCVTAGLTCITGFGNGVCTGCSDTVACKDGLRCVLGTCLPDIGSGSCDGVTCESDESCDPQNGACYPSNGSCAEDADCRPGHTCNFIGLCSGCSVDGDCRPEQRCLFATCVPNALQP